VKFMHEGIWMWWTRPDVHGNCTRCQRKVWPGEWRLVCDTNLGTPRAGAHGKLNEYLCPPCARRDYNLDPPALPRSSVTTEPLFDGGGVGDQHPPPPRPEQP